MTTPHSIFHALLRPSILQILRATGYHSARPAVLDSVTDLAARYLSLLCEGTASHAAHNQGDSADFTLVDIRLALEDAGAVLPRKIATQEEWDGEEDVRGVEEFTRWFAGQKMKEMMLFGNGDDESDATDYLNALKMKHSKTADDSKYQGTILGRPNEVGEIQVEGGPDTSINDWILKRSRGGVRTPTPNPEAQEEGGAAHQDAAQSPSASSGLSSLGDRIDDDDDIMDLT